jgi:hypothetical protein
MLKEWIAIEHYRLHAVEQWHHTEYKRASLAAIRSTLDSLLAQDNSQVAFTCSVCQSRKNAVLPIDRRSPGIASQGLAIAA